MKPQIFNNREFNLDRSLNRGFTLLELIVASAIIAMTTVWTIPEFRRGTEQAKIDRYAKNVESGLFSFKAKMGASKESCTIDFSNISSFQTGQYFEASTILEQQTILISTELTRAQTDPLYRCNYTNLELSGLIADSSEVTDLSKAVKRVQEVAATVRLVGQLNTAESQYVNVASTAKTYSFTPPGTSINANSMTLLIQSKEANQPWAKQSDGTSRLLTRCIEASGNGQIQYGTWTGNMCKIEFS